MKAMARIWLAMGGLLAIGAAILAAKETPSLRREFRIFRM